MPSWHPNEIGYAEIIKQAKKIRIAIDLGLPPFGMTDEKMQPTGSDVETARLLARHYGFTVEELDFIINYDIKYRMGQGNSEEDE